MKKLLTLSIVATAVLLFSGCGENYTDNEKKPKIGFNDTVHKVIYSFEDVVNEEDLNQTLDSYSLECDGQNGFLVDTVTDKKEELVYVSCSCLEKE